MFDLVVQCVQVKCAYSHFELYYVGQFHLRYKKKQKTKKTKKKTKRKPTDLPQENVKDTTDVIRRPKLKKYRQYTMAK